eukprot:Colp12_sorted_trinity150504_noHs@35762
MAKTARLPAAVKSTPSRIEKAVFSKLPIYAIFFLLAVVFLFLHEVTEPYAAKFLTLQHQDTTTGRYRVGAQDCFIVVYLALALVVLRNYVQKHLIGLAKSLSIPEWHLPYFTDAFASAVVQAAILYIALNVCSKGETFSDIGRLVNVRTKEMGASEKLGWVGMMALSLHAIPGLYLSGTRKNLLRWRLLELGTTAFLLVCAYSLRLQRLTVPLVAAHATPALALHTATLLRLTRAPPTVCSVLYQVWGLLWLVARHISMHLAFRFFWEERSRFGIKEWPSPKVVRWAVLLSLLGVSLTLAFHFVAALVQRPWLMVPSLRPGAKKKKE